MEQKIKYSDIELKEFEEVLLQKKEKTLSQISTFDKQIDEILENGKGEDVMDNSGYDSQMEYLVEYKSRNQKHLADIERALRRIEEKTYGICTVTGKRIDKSRLMAVPTTSKSIEGKKRR